MSVEVVLVREGRKEEGTKEYIQSNGASVSASIDRGQGRCETGGGYGRMTYVGKDGP